MPHAVPGQFIWYDHLTNDPAVAAAFYAHVVGWTVQPFQESYTMFVGAQGPRAGTTHMPERFRGKNVPPFWTASVCVADVDATAARVKQLGGRVLVEPADYPPVGRLAVIADPDGAPINVFKPREPMTLHDTTKPGEFVWHELLAADSISALAFHGALFGWTRLRDVDLGAMGLYRVFGLDGVELGGMFDKPKSLPAPPHWVYYVQVEDLDAAIERAKAKGARLVNGPMTVPGGARVAHLDDPQGGGFALHENARAT